jgi:ferritin
MIQEGMPMLKESMQNALNEQINREFYAFYLYLSMAAHFDVQNLTGFAHWMYVQSEEERGHAMRIFRFVNERGGQVKLHPIEAPPAAFGAPLSVFEQALEHERKVTNWINELYEQAIQEQDYATRVHVQWFVTEQVEEENILTEIVDKLKLAGDNKSALLWLDRDFRQRSPNAPADMPT